MSVGLRRQRDGELRPFWYGEFREADGKRKVVNVGEWRGTPPPSLLGIGDETAGDADFEASRKEAEAELKRHADAARRKGRVEHLTERLIESKTGRAVQYTRIDELPERWRNLGRESEVTEAHLANCDAHFRRFIAFMEKQKPKIVHLYQVSAEHAAAFVKELRQSLAPATAQYGVRLISKAFSRFLPVGSENPFKNFVGKRRNGTSGVVHRKPFTPDELRAILDTARDQSFMFPLIVTAACSGMRRGDVCGLKWKDVDLAGGMLTVKTSKTGGNVEIPIFNPLREVLEANDGTRKGYVFPEAWAMYRRNADGLSYRFKALVARALDKEPQESLPAIVPAVEIEDEAAAAVRERVPEGKRRNRMLDTLHRYAAGESVRQIAEATGCPKGTLSYDLNLIQDWIGKPFVRSAQKPSIRKAIDRVTRAKREQGQKAASIRDWHALRTTFVTLALAAGVPLELVRRVTGHATVEIVLKHYFRPDREQFRAALAGALPDVLTGSKATKRLKPADELAALAGKVAAGSATDKDKKRLRTLAAKV